jgi:hypothetical protein
MIHKLYLKNAAKYMTACNNMNKSQTGSIEGKNPNTQE